MDTGALQKSGGSMDGNYSHHGFRLHSSPNRNPATQPVFDSINGAFPSTKAGNRPPSEPNAELGTTRLQQDWSLTDDISVKIDLNRETDGES